MMRIGLQEATSEVHTPVVTVYSQKILVDLNVENEFEKSYHLRLGASHCSKMLCNSAYLPSENTRVLFWGSHSCLVHQNSLLKS
jgi:hypothetical protein